MTDEDDTKPCGTAHPLPCGLDRDCEIPAAYADAEKTDEEVWADYEADLSTAGAYYHEYLQS